ncbi:helix-turn-helix domain-containing protein [Caenimonas sp. SL110]|uniref:AlbA family DNA-binding domain-containing protein n=1 Tax=Caenimonas sp. SL110 TaxID=1450524 RepID=UPI00137937FF|nr:ATP-binding protein [Caenimonas sp. SL110]
MDFKRRYHFLSKDPKQKSELLKDILAMANAWRQGGGPAYILLGFQECAGGPPQVVGLDEHLDDAQIQQFIGSKVRPNLTFTYEELEYEGKQVGVITVPKQSRPFWVEKEYGVVRPNVVLVRRGSSTGEADPLEVMRMRDDDQGRAASSCAAFRLLDLMGLPFSSEYIEKRVALDFGDIKKLPDHKAPRNAYLVVTMVNSSYWRDFATFAREQAGAVLVRFELQNSSPYALNHGKLEVKAEVEGVEVPMLQYFKFEKRPNPDHFLTGAHTLMHQQQIAKWEKELSIDLVSGRPMAVWRFEKLLPSEHLTSDHVLAFFPPKSGTLKVEARLLAADQAPVTLQAVIEVEVEHRRVDFPGLQQLAADTALNAADD